MPYSEDDAAAKAAEMQLLYGDMEKSFADRLYRRVISEDAIERYKQFNPQYLVSIIAHELSRQ